MRASVVTVGFATGQGRNPNTDGPAYDHRPRSAQSARPAAPAVRLTDDDASFDVARPKPSVCDNATKIDVESRFAANLC